MEDNYSLFFVRHGKLSLPYKNHEEMPFDILADLAFCKINPPVDKQATNLLIQEVKNIIPFEKIDTIYTSPSRRCQKTAQLTVNFIKKNFDKKTKIKIIKDLKEINFDLYKICSSQKKVNINDINNKVLSCVINNESGCESIQKVYQRVKKLFDRIKKDKIILFITHDFLLRVVEIYIKNKGRNNITSQMLTNTKRNFYFRGFATNQAISLFKNID